MGMMSVMVVCVYVGLCYEISEMLVNVCVCVCVCVYLCVCMCVTTYLNVCVCVYVFARD